MPTLVAGSAPSAAGVELEPHAERLEHVGAADARSRPRGCRAWRPARPHAATTSAAAVETLNVPAPSPPVPQVSIAPAGRAGTRDRARAHARAPRRRARRRVSPFMRSATRSAADLRRRRRRRPRTRSDAPRPSRASDEVVPGRRRGRSRAGSHARLRPPAPAAGARKFPSSCFPSSVRIDSGWNCTPSTRQLAVAHAHDLALGASTPCTSSTSGSVVALDHERVVARRLERVRRAREERRARRGGSATSCRA